MILRVRFKKEDILCDKNFLNIRDQKKTEIFKIKKKRRVPLGPYAVFYFECYETLWWQIQEMLRIEKGGREQLDDEITAYEPLLPKGSDLVATLMIEIPDPQERKIILQNLGHIDRYVSFHFDPYTVKGTSADTLARTDTTGKTSAVHFLRFSFNAEEKKAFKEASEVTLSITHKNYTHTTHIAPEILDTLRSDLI